MSELEFLKVRATKRGFYKHLREVGTTFKVPRRNYKRNWMEILAEGVPPPGKPRGRSAKPADEST